MKNLSVLFILISSVALYSCKKAGSQNYWSFKGETFNTGYSSFLQMTGSALDRHYFLSCNGSAANSYLTIFFSDTSGSPIQGTCSVIAYDSINPPIGNQVILNIASGTFGNQTHYYPTGNSSDQVQVYMNNGKVAVKGTGIHLVNVQNASDNGTLDFDVTQTN